MRRVSTLETDETQRGVRKGSWSPRIGFLLLLTELGFRFCYHRRQLRRCGEGGHRFLVYLGQQRQVAIAPTEPHRPTTQTTLGTLDREEGVWF